MLTVGEIHVCKKTNKKYKILTLYMAYEFEYFVTIQPYPLTPGYYGTKYDINTKDFVKEFELHEDQDEIEQAYIKDILSLYVKKNKEKYGENWKELKAKKILEILKGVE